LGHSRHRLADRLKRSRESLLLSLSLADESMANREQIVATIVPLDLSPRQADPKYCPRNGARVQCRVVLSAPVRAFAMHIGQMTRKLIEYARKVEARSKIIACSQDERSQPRVGVQVCFG